ncbi:PREDICTED: germin-like protein 9-3 [Theobroma cacao]|uniref:Germin-like protein n=1 Tax=Theobroma cacao TaxID=3641 RepID=A0AB32WJ93_THECC|nr:PREDICTED: germin-like protein 9-3 [Theobroma cacao]
MDQDCICGVTQAKFRIKKAWSVDKKTPESIVMLRAVAFVHFICYHPGFSTTALTVKQQFFLALAIAFPFFRVAIFGDPDIITDFVVPAGANAVELDGKFFTYTGMRRLVISDPPANFTVTKAAMPEFPALNGQSVSYAVLQYPAGSVNPPHTHPRAAELLFLTYRTLEVGFVDTANRLFTQGLQAGDMFVFPKGLVHYQLNCDEKNFAIAISAFGSSAAGTVSVPSTVFATGIDDEILAKSFKTDVATIQKLKAGLAPKA